MSNDPYGSYPPPGGVPPVHGGQQQPPQPVWDAASNQWVMPPPPQQQPPPQQPPPGYGAPPQGYQPPPQATPELDAATRAAIEAEEREIASRRGGDVDWWNTTKPSRVGETTEDNIRVMPGAHGQPFFVKSWTHFVWLPSADQPGKKVRVPVTCARNGTPEGQPPAPCAVCERRDIAEQQGDKKVMDALKPRPRYFLNVLDLGDLQRHMKQEGPKAAIATFGPGLYGKLTKIMHAKGDISHAQYGRNIKIFTTKVGTENKDIRYDATDSSDACPVPQGFEACELLDLKKFEPESDYQDIRARMAEAYPVEGAVPPPQGQPPYGPPAGYQQPAQPQQPPPQPPPQQPPQQAPQGQPPQPVWNAATGQWEMPQPPAPPQQPPAPPQPVWNAATGQWEMPPQGPQQPPQQPAPSQGYQQPSGPPAGAQAPAQAPQGQPGAPPAGEPVNPDDVPF